MRTGPFFLAGSFGASGAGAAAASAATTSSLPACSLPAPAAAQFALASFSSFAELLSTAGGDAPAKARDVLAARFTPYEQEGVVLMPARVHIITGQAVEP